MAHAEALRDFGKDIGRRHFEDRSQAGVQIADQQRVIGVRSRLKSNAFNLQPDPAAVIGGNTGFKGVQQRRFALGNLRRSAGQAEVNLNAVGNADIRANQEIDLAAQVQRLTGVLKADFERQDNAVLVDEGLDAVGDVAGGHGPGKGGFSDIQGRTVVEFGRQPRLTRGAPVDMPALVHLEFQPQRHGRFGLTGGGKGGNHPHLGLHALHPERGVGLRRRCREQGRRKHGRHSSRNGGQIAA